jgi:hypothetical protein
MKRCEKCQSAINKNEGREFRSKELCEDCYIDEVMPKRPKSHYDNEAEFMQRLKESYPVRNQQFH